MRITGGGPGRRGFLRFRRRGHRRSPAGEDGDVILEGTYDSGGQFGASYEFVLQLDQELETAYCADAQID